jgi:hypothetical protein
MLVRFVFDPKVLMGLNVSCLRTVLKRVVVSRSFMSEIVRTN